MIFFMVGDLIRVINPKSELYGKYGRVSEAGGILHIVVEGMEYVIFDTVCSHVPEVGDTVQHMYYFMTEKAIGIVDRVDGERVYFTCSDGTKYDELFGTGCCILKKARHTFV